MSIDLFPPEVLTNVMLLASNKRESLTLRKGAHVPFPVILSSVCQRWRNVSLNTPAIWSSFAVDLWPSSAAADPQKYYERLYQALRMFLERSNNHLLDIELNTDWRNILGEYRFNDAMQLLSEQAHRWGTLILRGEANFPVVWVEESTSSLTNKLIALHTLIIHENAHSRQPSEQPTSFLGYLGTLPALRQLAAGVGRSFTIYLDSFTNLETLQMAVLTEFCGPEPIRELINASTSLRTLVLSYPRHKTQGFDEVGDITPIALNIESLHLRNSAHIIINNLGLTFPRLSSITIGFVGLNYELEPSFMDGFVELLQRSSTITSLTFDCTRVYDDQVIELLTHLPSLTTLNIRCPGSPIPAYPTILTPYFFEKLSEGQVVPLLERFYIHTMSRSVTGSAGAIAGMIRSRYADKRLRSLLIRLAGEPISEGMSSLEALSQDGLQVDVVETPWIHK